MSFIPGIRSRRVASRDIVESSTYNDLQDRLTGDVRELYQSALITNDKVNNFSDVNELQSLIIQELFEDDFIGSHRIDLRNPTSVVFPTSLPVENQAHLDLDSGSVTLRQVTVDNQLILSSGPRVTVTDFTKNSSSYPIPTRIRRNDVNNIMFRQKDPYILKMYDMDPLPGETTVKSHLGIDIISQRGNMRVNTINGRFYPSTLGSFLWSLRGFNQRAEPINVTGFDGGVGFDIATGLPILRDSVGNPRPIAAMTAQEVQDLQNLASLPFTLTIGDVIMSRIEVGVESRRYVNSIDAAILGVSFLEFLFVAYAEESWFGFKFTGIETGSTLDSITFFPSPLSGVKLDDYIEWELYNNITHFNNMTSGQAIQNSSSSTPASLTQGTDYWILVKVSAPTDIETSPVISGIKLEFDGITTV